MARDELMDGAELDPSSGIAELTASDCEEAAGAPAPGVF
jgi:hypothetical protein